MDKEQERRQQIASALESRNVRLPCPRCGNARFNVAGESDIRLGTNPNAVVIGGPVIPVAVVVCDQCGYVTQHATMVLGIHVIEAING